ncbi:MAG TPA: aminoglycoside phosphotransferase family protein [Thermoleophilaceae bacterium]
MNADVRQPLGEVVARGTRSSIHAYGAGAVIKVPHLSTPTDWILAEAGYTEAVRAVGAPVPRLLGIKRIDGRPASVWERIEGASMWQHISEQPQLSGALGELLAEIQLGLFALLPPLTLPNQRDRLVSKIRTSATTFEPSLAGALDVVPPLVSPLRLCHGDLHPSNVILSDKGPVIVDWFDASRGDPVADVARTLLTMRGDGSAGPQHLPGSDGRTLEALSDAYLARLRASLALDDALLARWQAVQAVARMAEGVSRDVLRDVWNGYDEPALQAAVAS